MRELRLEDASDAARVHKAMTELDDWPFLLSDYVQDEEFSLSDIASMIF